MDHLDYTEAFPQLQVTHVILLSCVGVLCVLSLTSLVVAYLYNRSFRLVHLVTVAQFTPTLLAGTIAWVVAQDASHTALEETVTSLLLSRSNEINEAITSDFEAGVFITRVAAGLHKEGFIDAETMQYPDSQRLFTLLDEAIGRSTDLVTLIYQGTNDGKVQGYRTLPSAEFVVGVLPGEGIPLGAACVGHSCPNTYNSTPDCTDRGKCCDTIPCDSTVGGKSAREVCAASCEGGYCPHACYGHGDVSVALNMGVPQRGPVDFKSYTPPLPVEMYEFNSTLRPWYRLEEGVLWSAPYQFQTGSEVEVVGFTTTLAFGTPDGQYRGTFAVDFTTQSLRAKLRQMLPSEGSTVLLFTPQGDLVAASEEYFRVVETDSGKAQGLVNVLTTSEPQIRSYIDTVRERMGSVDACHNKKILVQGSNVAVMCRPVKVQGLELGMIMVIPHDDIFGDANFADTVSLCITIAIGIVCSVLVALGMALVLRPLVTLVHGMNEVAWMRLEGVEVEKVRILGIKELKWMKVSFLRMITNLDEYRNFLPPSLLLINEPPPSTPRSTRPSATELEVAEVESLGTSDDSGSARITPMFNMELRRRNVTLVASNIRSFHKLLETHGPSDLRTAHAIYTSRMQHLSNVYDGVIESVQGDRFLLSFNAISRCQGHTIAAVRCATSIKLENLEVTCGVASGLAWCGNLGCQGLKQHSIVGKVMTLVGRLQHLTSTFDVHILSDPVVSDDMMGMCDVRKVDRVEIRDFGIVEVSEILVPPGDVLSLPTSGHTSPQSGSNAEGPSLSQAWMFSKTGEGTYERYNEAFDLMWECKYDEALDLLLHLSDTINTGPLVSRIQAAQASTQGPVPFTLL